MAEISNSCHISENSPKKLIWAKLAGNVKSSRIYSPLALDKISGNNDLLPKRGFGMRIPSFEANQSFPRISRSHFGRNLKNRIGQRSSLPRINMEHLCGDGPHSLSFSHASSPYQQTLFTEQKFESPAHQGGASFLSGFGSPSYCPIFNPSKAVFTIDSKTTEILVVNDAACNLLEYPASELVGTRLCNVMGRTKTQRALSEEHLDGELRHVVSFCGKVVEMVSKNGDLKPVSLWITRLQTEETGGTNRCLAAAEPVERSVSKIQIDSAGCIISADKCTAALFQYELKELIGMNIKQLIPSMKLPFEAENNLTQVERKQKATGRTLDGENFPLSLIMDECVTADESINYSLTIWVFANMSGLLVLGNDGVIEVCNHHFVRMMFGYSRAELLGSKISKIIPDFCERSEMILGSLPSSSAIVCDFSRNRDLDATTPQGNSKSQTLGPKGRMTLSSMDDVINSMGKLNVAYFSLSHSETEPETPKHQRRQRSSLALDRGRNVLSGIREPFGTPTKGTVDESGQQFDSQSDGESATTFSQSEDLVVTSTPAISSKAKSRKNVSPVICENIVQENEGTPSSSRIPDLDPLGNENSTRISSPYANGEYFGYGLHKDGALLNVKYRVQSALLTGSNRMVHCVWVAKNTSTDAEVTAVNGDGLDGRSTMENLTLAGAEEVTSFISNGSSNKSITKNDPAVNGNNNVENKNAIEHISSKKITSAFKELDNDKDDSGTDDPVDALIMEEGEYQQKYSSLYQIGKGAFGCVCMGFRKSDQLLVITKFIRKEKISEESWVMDPKMGKRVPLEISLLTTLKHPNIVTVLDVCENPTYFQLVMEKHGAGMDLFEFIDRNPDLDEPLISYIFRQVVSAVDYLHSLQILHRDIKDENIILNEAFHAKLIDFGSATFSSPGRLFSNFYGTVEYCSPEVLAGNKYEGPELEIWSMGVTLYVLCFGENPFFSVEETLKAELNPPYTVSEGLKELLEWMLEKDVSKRCTVEQLVDHPWLSQRVDISQYAFNEVVQCKPHEENPPTHYDVGEDIGSSYYSDTFFSQNEDNKENEECRGRDICRERIMSNENDAADPLLPLFSSFSCVSPSSSSSRSVDSSTSYHSASHSRGTTTSTMTSTQSVISLANTAGFIDNDTVSIMVPSIGMGSTRDEVSDNELQTDTTRIYDRAIPLMVPEDTDIEDFADEGAIGPETYMGTKGGDEPIIFSEAQSKSYIYDDLEDSSYDEQDSFS